MRAAIASRSQVHSFDMPENTEEDLDSPEELEAGSLAIADTTLDDEQVQGIWQRSTSINVENLPTDGTTVLNFEILNARILPPDGEDLKAKRYVIYELTIRQDSSILDPMPAIIERRYTDFRMLYISLKKKFPHKMSQINFPNKVLVGNFSRNLIAERSAAFEVFLTHIANYNVLRDSEEFLNFLQQEELTKACQLLDERRNEMAIPLLERTFRLLNKIYTDRSRPVLLILLRLVAACTTLQMPAEPAEQYAQLALNRYHTVCDIDLLTLYIPLLRTCEHLWWQRGRDNKDITERLAEMTRRGINVHNVPSLVQAIHKLDPRTETI